jgi:[CysO sulfur-carrier protein]-S-L-cysteine hydrolase
MPFRLLLPRRFHDEMLRHARQEQPNECCGLLAGAIEARANGERLARVERSFPLVNAAASPTRYDSQPSSLLQAHKAMRALGIEIVGIYHSHPTSRPVPSATDLERNFYGEHAVHFIISLQKEPPEIRAWWLKPDSFSEAAWECTEEG